MPTKLRFFLNFSLRFLLLSLAIVFITQQFNNKINLNDITNTFLNIKNTNNGILILVFVIVLMPLNWGIEIFKWNWLCKKFSNTKTSHCAKGVLSGTTISMFLPNRTGDFAARILWLDNDVRWQGVLANLYSSISLLIVTLIFGLSGFIFFPNSINFFSQYFFNSNILISIIIIICCLLFIVYFNFSRAIRLISNFLSHRTKVVSRKLNSLRRYTFKDLIMLVFFSSLRFCIYSSQFYLLLFVLGLKLPFFEGMIIISLMYLLITIIPQFAIAEIATRAAIALIVFDFGINELNLYSEVHATVLITASTLIWLINLFIPSVIGLFVLPDIKLFSKNRK